MSAMTFHCSGFCWYAVTNSAGNPKIALTIMPTRSNGSMSATVARSADTGRGALTEVHKRRQVAVVGPQEDGAHGLAARVDGLDPDIVPSRRVSVGRAIG